MSDGLSGIYAPMKEGKDKGKARVDVIFGSDVKVD
jgi:hypothetical protein